ncbi:MAG: aminoglycoside phosphotransferase family protein [bacterium]
MVAEPVRLKAIHAGAEDWLERLPKLIAELEAEWGFVTGQPYLEGTEAFVAEVTRGDGTPAVIKLLVPRDSHVELQEITVLRLANGEGCATLFESDPARGAMLLEQLGPSLANTGIPADERQAILCQTAQRIWRPAAGWGLPTGAEKGRWLIDFIRKTWEEQGRTCSEQAVTYAIECAERRIAAHNDERAVLVHGDIHQWNALQSGDGYKLVDPDGLLAEREYDLGVIMREDPLELMAGDPHERSRRLAALTGTDETAIWEWGAVERLSTALVLAGIDLEPLAGQMLRAAEFAAVSS